MKKAIFSLFILVSLSSCISLKESRLALPEPKPIEAGSCEISSPGAIYMNFFGLIRSDFLPAAIKIKTDSLLIYSDPQLFGPDRPADYIFITHNHYDHFSKKEIARLSDGKTRIIAPVTVTKKLKKSRCITAHVGDELEFGGLTVEVVESYNTLSSLHKKGNNYLGYVLTLGGIRVYIAGDTDFIPEMKELKNIDVAILPIGEGKTAMNPESASRAAQTIQPQLVIPIHYEVGEGREKTFSDILDPEIPLKFFQEPIIPSK
ncbi:MAG: MBL fold metallo-hydrolase [Bacteroidales bacterium]|nr:MBL fold metallo-hydrolase [Bacteroidales bacterium]